MASHPDTSLDTVDLRPQTERLRISLVLHSDQGPHVRYAGTEDYGERKLVLEPA
jgi:hypothetical protein